LAVAKNKINRTSSTDKSSAFAGTAEAKYFEKIFTCKNMNAV